MISIQGLHKAFGERALFDDAELRVGARDRIAIVGPNGSGKTTLFEMITGSSTPDGGRIDLVRGVVLGYLRQETDALRGRSIIDEVIAAAPAMEQAGHRLEILQTEMEEVVDASERDRLVAEFARLQEHFATLGGYSVDAEARSICAGLGFADSDLERRTETLSGGWLMRVALAKLLLAAPDILLLDEPTNHLDVESVAWLEKFLRAYEGAVLLISHDRDFMNAFATRVVEIEGGRLHSYTGDYAAFVEQRSLRDEQAAAAARNQQRAVAHTEAFINRFRYKASKARQVQSRIKSLEKMERVTSPSAQRRAMGIRFPTPPRAGRVVITLDNVSFSYADVHVYQDLSVQIERGQKVALVGPNGAGKTTLLKLFAGVLAPSVGERTLGHNVALGYFAQHQVEALDPTNRVIQELQRAVPPGTNVKPRDLLGRFLFSGSDAEKPVGVLSGGERSRLALAKLLVQPFNLLCMDEPTNHLDIQSRDVLEDALEDYEGALVLITHDRHLIRSVADTIIEVVDGHARIFPGDYERYLWQKEQEALPAPARAATVRVDAARADTGTPAERRKAGAADRARVKAQRDAIRKVERDLEGVHAEKARLSELLADTEFYARGEGVPDAVRSYAAIEARIKELETTWERLTDALNAD